MKISVLVVTKNAVESIRRSLDSIVSQDYVPMELIVVDGDSTDGTAALLSEYAVHIARMVSEPDSGPTDGINKALELATGDVVGFLLAGDWYEPGALKTVAGQACSCDVLCGAVLHWENGMPVYVGQPNTKRLGTEMSVGFPATFVRRELAERVGPFNEAFDIATDYDFLLRCREAGGVFCEIPDVLANMTLNGRSAKHWILGCWHTARSKMRHTGKPFEAFLYFLFQVLRGGLRRLLMLMRLGTLVSTYRLSISPCRKTPPHAGGSGS